MKKKIEVAAFLVVCIMVISFAIKAVQRHEKYQECKLSFSKGETESAKFAEVCK